MAGLKPKRQEGRSGPTRCAECILWAIVALLGFVQPADAAGWFYRDNQVAYKLYLAGDLQHSLEHWDRSAQGSFGRGTALMALGRMPEAEQSFRRCLALMPAQKRATGSVEGPPGNPAFVASIWYNLGNTLYVQDKLTEAAAAWRKALDYQPEHAKARHNLKIVNRLLGKPSEDEDNPSALAGKNRLNQKGMAQSPAAGKNQPAGKPPAKQQNGEQKKGKGKQMAKKAGGRHHQGSDKDKPQDGQGMQASAAKGHGKNQPGKGKGVPQEESVSVIQANNELRLVEEGVGAFMRHRLNPKHARTEAPYRGPAW